MLHGFVQLGPFLTTGFSRLYGTDAKQIHHPPDMAPAAVLNLAYPVTIGSEIIPVEFDVIETMVSDIIKFAVKHSNRPPAQEELSTRRAAVISELKAAFENAVDVYEFEFTYDLPQSLEWEFAYLFLGKEYSWVIHTDCVCL